MRVLETSLKKQILKCGIKIKPHIESRINTLKLQFWIAHKMLTGPNCNSFRWDPEKKNHNCREGCVGCLYFGMWVSCFFFTFLFIVLCYYSLLFTTILLACCCSFTCCCYYLLLLFVIILNSSFADNFNSLVAAIWLTWCCYFTC